MEALIKLLLMAIFTAIWWAFIMSNSRDSSGFAESLKLNLKYVWYGFLLLIALVVIAAFLNATGLDSLFSGGDKFECFYYC
ncbi:MAG: hypothetical protein ABGX42_03205 [Gammaproteobacteria bacterium]|jgi:ABC-type Mn2+/Zn2+ transport system permease subunit